MYKALAIILTIPVAALIRAYVLSKLWLWFIVSTFALPVITLPVAYGISCLVILLTYQSDAKDKEEAPVGQTLAHTLLFSPLALLLGWLATLFM